MKLFIHFVAPCYKQLMLSLSYYYAALFCVFLAEFLSLGLSLSVICGTRKPLGIPNHGDCFIQS